MHHAIGKLPWLMGSLRPEATATRAAQVSSKRPERQTDTHTHTLTKANGSFHHFMFWSGRRYAALATIYECTQTPASKIQFATRQSHDDASCQYRRTTTWGRLCLRRQAHSDSVLPTCSTAAYLDVSMVTPRCFAPTAIINDNAFSNADRWSQSSFRMCGPQHGPKIYDLKNVMNNFKR